MPLKPLPSGSLTTGRHRKLIVYNVLALKDHRGDKCLTPVQKFKNLQHTPSILQCHNLINVKNSWHFRGSFCIEYSYFYPPNRSEF